jgi:hypothetical protein
MLDCQYLPFSAHNILWNPDWTAALEAEPVFDLDMNSRRTLK